MIVLQEKRDNPRLNIYLASSLRHEDEEKRSFSIVRNISSTGLYLTTKSQYEHGSITDCIVSIDDKPISFTGKVVRMSNNEPYNGYGIHITDIDEEDMEELNAFIEKSFYEKMNNPNDVTNLSYEISSDRFGFDKNDYRSSDNFSPNDFNYIETEGHNSRLLQANFPYMMNIEEFDTSLQDDQTKAEIDNILAMNWINDSKNVLISSREHSSRLGLAIGIGTKAIAGGYKVTYTTMRDLLNFYNTERQSTDSMFMINRFMSSRAVIIDQSDLYLSAEDANTFYKFVNEVYGKTSLIMLSNLTFEDWKDSLGNSQTFDTISSRLEHNVYLRGYLN